MEENKNKKNIERKMKKHGKSKDTINITYILLIS